MVHDDQQPVIENPLKSVLPERISELDGLRAIACLFVVVAHYSLASGKEEAPSWLSVLIAGMHRLSLPNLAVIFFYTLSAFLLTFLGVREYRKTGSFKIKQFLGRRFFRIWPLYFFMLLIALLLAMPGGLWGTDNPGQWQWLQQHFWFYLTFLSNWSLAFNAVGGYTDSSPPFLVVLWSIAVEEQFYLFFPFLLSVLLPRKRRLLWIVALLIAIGLSFRAWFLTLPVDNSSLGSQGGMYYATLTYCDVFLAGGFAGWFVTQQEGKEPSWIPFMQQPVVGISLLGAIVALTLIWQDHLWYPYSGTSIFIYGVTGSLFALGIVWVLANREALLCRLLRSPIMQRFGLLTYGLYLWHLIAQTIVKYDTGSLVLESMGERQFMVTMTFLLYLSTTLGFASLTYGLIEQPFLLLKLGWLLRKPMRPWNFLTRDGWWVITLVSLFTWTLLQVGIQLYFGASTQTRFSPMLNFLGINQEQIVRSDPFRVLYVPSTNRLSTNTLVTDSQGKQTILKPGNIVLMGPPYQLRRLREDGRWVSLKLQEGQTLQVANLGSWNSESQAFQGLPGVVKSSQLTLDPSFVQPLNENANFQDSTLQEPIKGFSVSPPDGGYTVRLLKDARGSFVRISATRPEKHLVLVGSLLPPLGMDQVPATLQGSVRAHSTGQITLTLYDRIDSNGKAEGYQVIKPARLEWQKLSLQVRNVQYPDPSDHFSLGLTDVQANDWFDVREFSLFQGILP
ncbi:MAG: acyltransferase [Leptolyngbyaceae cyanobacterium bins.59]|nr:acyltransferase [Leptolyngbyaceae cyanobacterium bins.59]